jgi:hypothetical protein
LRLFICSFFRSFNKQTIFFLYFIYLKLLYGREIVPKGSKKIMWLLFGSFISNAVFEDAILGDSLYWILIEFWKERGIKNKGQKFQKIYTTISRISWSLFLCLLLSLSIRLEKKESFKILWEFSDLKKESMKQIVKVLWAKINITESPSIFPLHSRLKPKFYCVHLPFSAFFYCVWRLIYCGGTFSACVFGTRWTRLEPALSLCTLAFRYRYFFFLDHEI